MKKVLFNKFLFILFTIISLNLSAQENLVPNGNFNERTECTSWNGKFVPRYWNTVYNQAHQVPDTCQYDIFLPTETSGRDGTGSGAIVTYEYGTSTTPNFRFYQYVQLKSPLKAQEWYYVEMYVKFLVDSTKELSSLGSHYFTDHQDIAFLKTPNNFRWSATNRLIATKPLLKSNLTARTDWRKIYSCFQAQGDERYIYIGNFSDNDNTTADASFPSTKRNSGYSVYFVDDVSVIPLKSSLPADTAICEGVPLNLDISLKNISNVSYAWQDGTTIPQFSTTKAGNYIYTKDLFVGCYIYESINVRVVSKKNILTDTLACKDKKLQLKASNSGLLDETYAWETGEKSQEIPVNTEGVYSVKITNRCAQRTDSFRVKYEDCNIIAYVPNIFSPNGDGENDYFKPYFRPNLFRVSDYQFQVFNQWGGLVFTSMDTNIGWNGRFKGTPSNSGVYLWFIKYKAEVDGILEDKILTGDVMLVR